MKSLTAYKFSIAMNIVFATCLAFAAHGSANVFDDAVFWFRGGKDKNGDGYMDYGEFFDDLRATTPNDGNHNMTMSSTLYTGSSAAFKGNAMFGNEQVVFPALGTNIVKEMQVLHISDDIQGGKYYFPFAVNPRHVFARNEISNEYTIVSRIRLDDDTTHRSFEKCFLKVGYNTNDLARQQGMWLGFKAQDTTKRTRQITCRRISDTTGNDSAFDFDLHVPTNTWVDLAVVVGNGKLRVSIAVPQSLSAHGNNSTIAFAETEMRTDNYELLEDPDGAYYMLFCRDGQKIYAQANSTDKSAFIGSIQQMAIWGRALSDQEVMAAFGMPRPTIFKTGLDNGASGEFGGVRSGSTQTIDGLGSWQNIANTMKGGDTWTVNFNALRDEAGLAQVFSIKSLSGSAALIEPVLNGTSLGEGRIAANSHAFWPVAANLVVVGENTLVIKRKDGGTRDFIVDAMELGGSLGVGTISQSSTDDGRTDPRLTKTGVPSAADPNTQHWPQELMPYTGITNLHLRVWVDPDVSEKASFTFGTTARAANRSATQTATGSEYFEIYINGEYKTKLTASATWRTYTPTFQPGELRDGWNDFEFITPTAYPGCRWYFGYFRFEAVLPSPFGFTPPPGVVVIFK